MRRRNRGSPMTFVLGLCVLLLCGAGSPAGAQAAGAPATAPIEIAPSAAAQTELAPIEIAPPTSVVVQDTRNDAGRSLTLRWQLSPADVRGDAAFLGYEIQRAQSPQGPFEVVGDTPAQTAEFIDTQNLVDGTAYYYQIAAKQADARGVSAIAGPGISAAQWFHTGRVNTLIAVLVLSGLIIYFIEHARRGRPIFIRKIAGLEAVRRGGRPRHRDGPEDPLHPRHAGHGPGADAGRDRHPRARRAHDRASTRPRSSCRSRGSLVMVAAARRSRRRTSRSAGPTRYNDDMVYYLTDDQFGYAAALDGIMVRERPATIFLQGSFYAESLILAETGNSIGAIQIAGTAQPAQLPFFVAACDYTLIGEELFVAGAYLSREPRQLGSLKGQDIGKAVILLVAADRGRRADAAALRLLAACSRAE